MIKKCLLTSSILSLLFIPFLFAYSFSIDEKLSNNEMEKRAIELFKVIKCPACSGESIFESQSQAAHNIRQDIRNKIRDGYSNKEIITQIRKYYGNQAVIGISSYQFSSIFLWIIPVLSCLIGVTMIHKTIKKLNKKPRN